MEVYEKGNLVTREVERSVQFTTDFHLFRLGTVQFFERALSGSAKSMKKEFSPSVVVIEQDNMKRRVIILFQLHWRRWYMLR